MLTRQEAFTKIVNGLDSQGERAWDEEAGQCLYRTKDFMGNTIKCAVGQLIPDSAPLRVLNSTLAVVELVSEDPKMFWDLIQMEGTTEDLSFLSEMQFIHDQEQSWEQGITKAYASFAKEKGYTL